MKYENIDKQQPFVTSCV